MTARAEHLEAPAPSHVALAVFALVATATTAILRLWQRPTTLVMSDDWLNDRMRIESRRGSW